MTTRLVEALDDLYSASIHIDESRKYIANWVPSLDRLKGVVDHLGRSGMELQIQSNDYLEDWKRYTKDKSVALTKSSIRYLCWDPSVSLTQTFFEFIQPESVLSRKCLVGLLRSCHQKWSNEVARSSIVSWLSQKIVMYDGQNALIEKWKKNRDMVLDPEAHEYMAKWMISEFVLPEQCAREWFLDQNSEFLQMTAECAVERIVSKSSCVGEVREYLFKLMQYTWSRDRFIRCISKVICLSFFQTEEDARVRLKNFILANEWLKDPRLPANNHLWSGVSAEAKSLFISWLSALDISFFFEHVLPKGKDPHGRKEFWLNYAKSLVASRPILSGDDRNRLKPYQSNGKVEMSHCGEMSGGYFDSATSAFILDFGNIVAVEFSKTGNALYFYDRRDLLKSLGCSDYWSLRTFTLNTLKNKSKAISRVVHRDGWRSEANTILAGLGIRPKC